jgi:hypothetical protein
MSPRSSSAIEQATAERGGVAPQSGPILIGLAP